MCFSAGASFAASAIISSVGVAGYRKAKGADVKTLALIPIFFGLQQFAEGFVWLGLTNDYFSDLLIPSNYIFIFFAWMVWPFLIPYLMFSLEVKSQRKRWLKYFLILGITSSLILLYVAINHGVNSSIQDCSILYDFDLKWRPWKWFGLVYITTTVLPTFVSSIPKIGLFGLLNVLSYIVTKIYWHDEVISIWCFFSAIASLIIYWSIISTKKRQNIH